MAKIEVLCATMNQKDFSKVKEMNIKTNVLFANQAGENRYSKIEQDGICARMITTDTVGVGINRNIALMNSDSDICLFSDDDIKYVDNYAQIIESAFSELPDADALIFNIETIGEDHGRRINAKIKKLSYHNCLNYGAARIAVKSDVIKNKNIYFHRNFGGGTEFSSGEDSLFIWDMIKKGMKVYAYPAKIGSVDQTTSTWFKGYNKKYIFDKGALFFCMSKSLYRLFCLYILFKHKYMYKGDNMTFFEAYKLMMIGAKSFKKGISHSQYLNITNSSK